MSNIQQRLDSLSPYVVGIRYTQSVPIIDTVLKDGWKVPTSEIIKSHKGNDSELNYYMFYTEKEGVSIDELLDYVDRIIQMNIEREKKYELLQVKVKELKDLFRTNSLDKIKNMKFIIGDDNDLISNLSEVDPIDNIEVNIHDVNETIPQTQVTPIINENTSDVPSIENDGEIKEEFEHFNLDGGNEIRNVNGSKIELPKKNKIKLEEFNEPNNIVCSCGPDDVCPVCEEQKEYS